MNTNQIQDIQIDITAVKKELDLKAMQMLRKHLQNNKCSKSFKKDMAELEHHYKEYGSLPSDFLEEIYDIMADDLDTYYNKSKKSVHKKHKTPVKAVTAEAVQEEKPDVFPYTAPVNGPIYGIPAYTPPGYYSSVEAASGRDRGYDNCWESPENQAALYQAQQDKAGVEHLHNNIRIASMYQKERMRYMLKQALYDPREVKSVMEDAAITTPYSSSFKKPMPSLAELLNNLPVFPTEEVGSQDEPSHKFTLAEATVEQLAAEAEPDPFLKPKEFQDYFLKHYRTMSMEATTRFLGVESKHIKMLIDPNSKDYDCDFPLPIRIGRSLRFRMGDLLTYIQNKPVVAVAVKVAKAAEVKT